MNRLSSLATGLCALALTALPVLAPAAASQEPSSQAQAKSKTDKDAFDKAGEATQGAFKKAGKATEKGLEAAGKGTGTAVEHTGRGVTTAAKATAGAMSDAGKAIADFFDGKPGDQDRVREVQRALQQQGYYQGAIDGIVGPKTKSGVREFQQDENLPVTGKVDEKTAEQLGVD
jgi:peptidoglycan hydrolase-like protein with peptidoglycan-binding domain